MWEAMVPQVNSPKAQWAMYKERCLLRPVYLGLSILVGQGSKGQRVQESASLWAKDPRALST